MKKNKLYMNRNSQFAIRNTILSIWIATLLIGMVSCQKDDKPQVDREPPSIDISFAGAFPIQCSELKRGETTVVKVRLSDNIALGSFSVDIHHNFDHHSHSTEVVECDMEPVKIPVKPFVFIRSYDIPNTPKTYETNVEITIPNDIDTGDYHFMVTVTDREGWSKMIGLSVKII